MCLFFAGVGPELEGNVLTWLRRLPVEQKIDQQGL